MKRVNKITTIIAAIAFAIVVFYSPFQVAKHNTEHAFAGGAGGYLESTGLLAKIEQTKTAIETTLTAAATNLTAFNTGSIWFKENVLDPLAWTVGKTLLAQFTQSIVNWINSGFQGSPAFVTDLKGFLLNVADMAAGEFINDKLGQGFLCEPYEIDIKIALSIEYATTRDFQPPECTISDIVANIESFIDGNFSEGGWEGWLELTQRPTSNTEYGQYLSSKIELDGFVANRQDEQEQLLDFGNGFLSQTICFPVDGKTREDCLISNPGKVIETQLNEALGLGQDSLVVADEFNEIIGALFNQLAQQAITGVNGLLGLSAGTGYTDYSYAEESNGTALLDAIVLETQGVGAGDSDIHTSIGHVNDWISYQQFVVDTVDGVETENSINAGNTSLIPGCYDLNVPTSLLNKRVDAQSEIDKATNNTLPALNDFLTRLASADDDAAASLLDDDQSNDTSFATLQQEVYTELATLQTSGAIPTTVDIQGAEVRDRQAFQEIIFDFEEDMKKKVIDCTPEEISN